MESVRVSRRVWIKRNAEPTSEANRLWSAAQEELRRIDVKYGSDGRAGPDGGMRVRWQTSLATDTTTWSFTNPWSLSSECRAFGAPVPVRPHLASRIHGLA